jgi:CRISPR-associated protein Cas2
MARRRYLVAYDISDPDRLRDVGTRIKGFGFRLQYSVYVCDLDEIEHTELVSTLGSIIHLHADSVAIVDLGDPRDRGTTCFSFMGRFPHLPSAGGPQIV